MAKIQKNQKNQKKTKKSKKNGPFPPEAHLATISGLLRKDHYNQDNNGRQKAAFK